MSSSSSDYSSDEDDVYEVKEILNDRLNNGVREYYVKWKDQFNKRGKLRRWSKDKYDSWTSNTDCSELIAKYKEEKRKRRSKEERRSKEREEHSNKISRDTPSDKTNKKEKTSRRDGESSKRKDDDGIPRSSRKKKHKKIVVSDEDEDGSSQERRKEKTKAHNRNSSLDDRPCSSSSLRTPVPALSSLSSRNSQISSPSFSTAFKIPLLSGLKIKSEAGDSYEVAAKPRSLMDSSEELKKLRKENKEKGVKTIPAKSVKRKGKPLVFMPIVEDEQTGEPTTPLFQSTQVKKEQPDQMDMSASQEPSNHMDISQQDESNDMEESGSEENNEGSRDSRETDSVERRSEEEEGGGGGGAVEGDRENSIDGNEMGEEEGRRENGVRRDENDQNGEVTGERREEGEIRTDAQIRQEETEGRVTEEGERFLVDPDIDENHGYLQGLKGKIVSHDLLLFHNNTQRETYFKVVFLEIKKSFWLRYDVVRQFDPAGYRMYLRQCIRSDRDAKKTVDARRYRELHEI